MRRIRELLKSRKGEGYIDVAVMVVVVMLVIALGMRVFPVFIAKMQLDNMADELVREAEISGRVGAETTIRYQQLCDKTGLTPEVVWSNTGNIQLNHEIRVTLLQPMEIGLFGEFGSFPVTLEAEALGKSEVYHR